MNRLFVYGTLAPGQPNEHVLTRIGGTFQPASLRGHLKAAGWGAGLGYPGIVPDPDAMEVSGFVFSSPNLTDHWADLDAFEGDEYQRVKALVTLADGENAETWVYALRTP